MTPARPRKKEESASRRASLRIGFVPLIDASPLLVASEEGYFEDEGLLVELQRQIGWGNVRDRLTYGELQASHGPLGMVPASVAGLRHYEEPLAALVALGTGGNAITISLPIADLGDGPTAPARWRKRLGRPLNLAHVFSVASHHFALRHLIDVAGLHVESDVRLCVLPPAQMRELLQRGVIDGYCAGEPWGTLAVSQGVGSMFCATTELMPAHPEKVLAVTQRWLASNDAIAVALTRAVIRGCDFCEDPANRSRLVEILASRRHLAIDEAVIAKSLSIDNWLRPGIERPPFRSFARPATVTNAASIEWIVGEMIRWGQLPPTTDAARLARESVNDTVYANAITSLGSPRASIATRQLQGTRK